MTSGIAFKDERAERRLYRTRVLIAFAAVLIAACGLLVRMFYLQIVMHETYMTESDKNRLHLQSVPPNRGLLYDRNGVLLADNRPVHRLTLVKERIPDMEQTIAALVDLIGITEDEVRRFNERLGRSRRPFESVPLRFKLTEEEIARLSVERYRFPGVEIEAQLSRHYPHARMFAHAVGYVGRINEAELQQLDQTDYAGTHQIGKIGIERYYEDALHGSVGYQTVETNARGRVLKVISRTDPVPGDKLTLTLDIRLQQAAIEGLAGRRGAVVAIEPRTGDVLALVSEPSYDPNPFVTGIDFKSYSALRDSPDLPLYNRAVRGRYPPGSTIKPFFAIAGLDAGLISRDYRIWDPGYFRLPNDDRKYRDWKKTGHGWVDLHRSIQQSCDTYYYELAFRMGVDRISAYLARFGFGRPTGLDIQEELGGLLPSREWKQRVQRDAWYHGDTVNIGIGQGFMLDTPVHLAAATAMLSLRGKWVQPRMLRARAGIDAPVQEHPERFIELATPAGWELVLDSMRSVVHSVGGTAFRISRNAAFEMAGKTGTAQVIGMKEDEEYDEEKVALRHRDHALFIGFAPYEDPRIAVAVIVENGGHGGSTAAPIARMLFDVMLAPEEQAGAAGVLVDE